MNLEFRLRRLAFLAGVVVILWTFTAVIESDKAAIHSLEDRMAKIERSQGGTK